MNIAVTPVSSRDRCEVAIVGAGPYGLAVAAHLRAANVPIRVFGEPLSFWRAHMPAGMMLRSPWIATHIAQPRGKFTLDDYYREAGMAVPDLLPVETFVDYGRWFQERVAPDLDKRKVARVEPLDGGFRLVLETGDVFYAERVVMAQGLLGHEHRPAQFDGLPRQLVSHSCEHTDSERYRGKRVAVIGRGQSACESAAILHEAGADVEIICRGSLVWNADPGERSTLRKAVRALIGDMLIPPSQVGPFPFNWLNEIPGAIHQFPQRHRERLNVRSLGPTAILWLRPRLKHIPIHQQRRILNAQRVGERVALTLDNGTRRYDHVMLATGYRIDVNKMAMLDPRLRGKVVRRNGLPVLSGGFESSVAGLHFVGASAVASFGPLLRFIAGAGFAARRVTGAALHASRRAASGDHAFVADPAPLSLAAERE
ncbi:MAG TPA: NAD(P)/FAD-dependent oxidoreductase [Pseudolabrys sp.]|nr:NAD(P)/FAD-dependent oxidoreductase [Pseudolabrys sp.]